MRTTQSIAVHTSDLVDLPAVAIGCRGCKRACVRTGGDSGPIPLNMGKLVCTYAPMRIFPKLGADDGTSPHGRSICTYTMRVIA